jgi:hypothetical protein
VIIIAKVRSLHFIKLMVFEFNDHLIIPFMIYDLLLFALISSFNYYPEIIEIIIIIEIIEINVELL